MTNRRVPFLKKLIETLESMDGHKVMGIYELLPYYGAMKITDTSNKKIDTYYIGIAGDPLAIDIGKEEFDLWRKIDDIYCEKYSL